LLSKNKFEILQKPAMNLGKIVTWSFFISLVMSLVGAFMKILHLPGADQLLIIGMVSNGVFVVSALSEVWRSERIDKNEKIMWTIAFVFMGFLGAIAGIVYLLMGRKRVA
jgi:predicted membrane channel-forming protein YqfA (hemolysin III family)